MKISHRLYLTVVPAILGVALMGALVYWGQYQRTAPALVLVIGALAVVGSGALAWTNARFVALRIERLAASIAALPRHGGLSRADELDRIEAGVDRLNTDLGSIAADRASHEAAFDQRTREYAAMLARIADQTARQLAEVRLPLHILLENHFGELNENQEEMLGAAGAAAEAADSDLVSLRQIAELDGGQHTLRRDRLKPSEIIDSLQPMLAAAAESVGAAVTVDIAPLLPPILGDRARLQNALSITLGDAIRSSVPGTTAHLSVEQRGSDIHLAMSPTGSAVLSVRSAAAERVIAVHGGRVDRGPDALNVCLPLRASVIPDA
jgi:K+-sensing histidine kinase KdpD